MSTPPAPILGIGAEERGQGEAIARSTERCLTLGVPMVAVIAGEGGSGGAIAIAAANIVLMLEHSIYSVISPEGAASILYKKKDGDEPRPDRVKDVATALQITAQDLLALKVIDAIIQEPIGGAHREPSAAIAIVGAAVAEALDAACRLGFRADPHPPPRAFPGHWQVRRGRRRGFGIVRALVSADPFRSSDMTKNISRRAAALGLAASAFAPIAAAQDDGAYTEGEVIGAAERFFGAGAEGVAEIVRRVFERSRRTQRRDRGPRRFRRGGGGPALWQRRFAFEGRGRDAGLLARALGRPRHWRQRLESVHSGL